MGMDHIAHFLKQMGLEKDAGLLTRVVSWPHARQGRWRQAGSRSHTAALCPRTGRAQPFMLADPLGHLRRCPPSFVLLPPEPNFLYI